MSSDGVFLIRSVSVRCACGSRATISTGFGYVIVAELRALRRLQHDRDPLPPVEPALGDEPRRHEERRADADRTQDRQRDVVTRAIPVVERHHHRILRQRLAVECTHELVDADRRPVTSKHLHLAAELPWGRIGDSRIVRVLRIVFRDVVIRDDAHRRHGSELSHPHHHSEGTCLVEHLGQLLTRSHPRTSIPRMLWLHRLFALPGILLLIVFILVRPQEFIPLLQKLPFLHLFTAFAVIGYVIDVRLRRLQPIAANTLPWVTYLILIWMVVTTAVNVPRSAPSRVARRRDPVRAPRHDRARRAALPDVPARAGARGDVRLHRGGVLPPGFARTWPWWRRGGRRCDRRRTRRSRVRDHRVMSRSRGRAASNIAASTSACSGRTASTGVRYRGELQDRTRSR